MTKQSRAQRPHPQQEAILRLLREGHTNTAVREQTGAGAGAVARIRARAGIGPATIVRRATRTHPKDAEIRAALTKKLSNSAIAGLLSVDRSAVRRIRAEMGVPIPPLQPLSLEEKWDTQAKPVGRGHMEWTGSRQSKSGTPVLRYKERIYTAASVAFRRRTGRAPVGQAKAECGVLHCVAQDHVEDEPGRQRLREQYRHLVGLGERPARCRKNHDQTVHGRLLPDGRSYCTVCSAVNKQKSKA
ncbi:hypothetical protein ACWDO7_22950 [Streptomyces sp. NPDC003656]